MNAHTPGPWSLLPNPEKEPFLWVENGFRTLALVCAGTETPEVRANGRLIAAAPELLDCLRKVVEMTEAHGAGPFHSEKDWNELWAKVDAAIAKATKV